MQFIVAECMSTLFLMKERSYSFRYAAMLYYRAYAVYMWGPNTVFAAAMVLSLSVRTLLHSVPMRHIINGWEGFRGVPLVFYMSVPYSSMTLKVCCRCNWPSASLRCIVIIFFRDFTVAPVRLIRCGCVYSYPIKIVWVAMTIVIYCEALGFRSTLHLSN